MRIALPCGGKFGWGICGQNLTRELSKFPPLPENITIHAISGPDFAVLHPDQWNKYNVGLCFIEDDVAAREHIDKAKRFDLILAGSEWNAAWLRDLGLERVGVFTQGIDPLFHYRGRKQDGLFVVFSGGKAEYRKGQDLVIFCMAEFMRKHQNVWLSAAWDNQYKFSLDTLRLSPFIKYVEHSTCRETLLGTLGANGIPLDRVVLHPPLANTCMAGIYWDSDYGIFPNRCEAGNNMVLSEYMACGRPVAASYGTGHKDVLRYEWAEQHLTHLYPDRVYDKGTWLDPDPEEILDRLEAAYGQERELLDMSGLENAKHMKQFTWARCAEQVYRQTKEALQL